MFKNIIYFVSLCLLLVGCAETEGSSNVTMDSYVKAFENESIEVDQNEKPAFSMIGAKDGIIFYNDLNVVKIYEFRSQKEIKTAEEAIPAIEEWERNGLFLLETNDEQAKTIFKNTK